MSNLALHTQFFENFPEPVCIVARGLICTVANSAFLHILGLHFEVSGRVLSEILPQQLARQILPFIEHCFGGCTLHNHAVYLLPNNIPTDCYGWVLATNDGVAESVALWLHLNPRPEAREDRMKIELEQMQRLLSESHRRNVEIKAALRHQAAQNIEAQRRKDQFLATISHQLRNHLSPVRNAARFLNHKLSTESEVQWCVTVIDRQISQFTRLIEELQDLARLESGQFELNKERLLLDDVISQAVEWIQPVFEDHQQNLEVIYPQNNQTSLWVEADFQRLSQALENLLRNAAHYARAHGRLQLSAISQGEEVVITVCDYGRAIHPNLLPRIFDLYGELPAEPDQPPEKEPVIGLAVVRQIVEFHGGSVQAVYLDPELGNQRILRLPRIPPPEPNPISSGEAEASAGQSPSRILVVDDNEDVAVSFGALLEVLGYDVRVVLDGALAIELVREFMPQIVFLDIAMPEMDGYTVAERIRAEYRSEALRLVAVTGYGQDHDAERAQRAGFDHHLLKPVDLKDLQVLLGH